MENNLTSDGATTGDDTRREPMRPRYDPVEDEISPLHLLTVLLKHRYWIAGLSFAVALVLAVHGLLLPRNYTTEGSFIPQGVEPGGGGGAAQIAGQLGISLPGSGGAPTESPAFYAELLGFREILAQVLADSFTVSQTRWGETILRAGTLLDLLDIDEEAAEALRREEAIRWLREKAVSARTTPETGMVRVSVTTPWPEVSEALGRRLLDLVNDFNRRTRQTQAASERTFIEERIVEAEERLLAAEDDLKRFLENNRQFQNSPDLLFEHDRLQRQVAMRQQLYTSLSQAYEDARVAEVRNTPLITVVEPPEEPVEPDGRSLALRGILGLVLGGMGGVFFAFTREFVGRSREEGDNDYREFQKAWEDTVDDLKRLVGRGRRDAA
jgi:uncharacterized protein involved in exopolysaccharide biosynthesis